MERKSAIIIAIIIMCIGFAAVSTTLIINGNAKVSENIDDFSVIFTSASLDGEDVYNDVIDDTKKIINFNTKDLKKVGDTSVLSYEVTNNSINYDAEVSVNCKVKEDKTAKYTSIKNELENNTTIVKAKESINGTLTVTLNKTATEEVREEYVCVLTFNAVERDTMGVASINLYNMIKDNADTTSVIDYKVRSGAEGKETNGIYTTTATEANIPVYYYRGKVDNNIIFGNFCWKIIRTTETGGVKLIFNGIPTDGKCEIQTGSDTQIGTSVWNTKYDDVAYVGYMFGINNTGNSTSKEEAQTNTYESIIKKYLDNWFKDNMLNYDKYLEDTVFCNDRSIVTGNMNNSLGTAYGIIGYGKNATAFGVVSRASYFTITPNPNLTCTQVGDKFTVDQKNGNGKLLYPVGFLTLDEAVLAGFNANKNIDLDENNYLYTSSSFWTMSPTYMTGSTGLAAVGLVGSYIPANKAYIDASYVNSELGVRPVISLKSGTTIEPTGEGTTTNPYVVK